MKNLLLSFITMLLVSAVLAQGGEFHLDKEYKISKAGILDLRCSDAKVFVTGSVRTSAHIKIDRKITAKGWSWGERDFDVTVVEENGNVSVREKQGTSSVGVIGYYNEEYKIEIELPEGASLDVRGDDGDYFIKNVNGSVTLNLDDADAELVGCRGSSFEFRLDDGDITMDSGSGKLEVDGDDATVEIFKGNFSSIRARLDDGDLLIETSLDDKGEYSIESQDGIIALNITAGGGEFDIRHDDTHVLREGNFKTLLETERETVVSLPSGSAKVSIRADDARVKLRAK